MALALKSRSGAWSSSSDPSVAYPRIRLVYLKRACGWEVLGKFEINSSKTLPLPGVLPGYPFATRAQARAAVCSWAAEKGMPGIIPRRFV